MKAFFDRATVRIQDVVGPEGRGLYGGKTIADYGDSVVIMDLDEAESMVRAKYIEPPKRITKERFWWMLEVLPPCKWARRSGAEAFHISERIYADLVSWVVRVGDDYWELVDSDKLTFDEVVHRVFFASPETLDNVLRSEE